MAAPLVQIPVFIVNMCAVREMCLLPWPGLETGGALWFPDLTQPAVNWAEWFPPKAAQLLLPSSMAALYIYSLHTAFAKPAAASGPVGAQAAHMDRIWSTVRLVLEWGSLPMLLVALSLPPGILLYWNVSMAFTALQRNLQRLQSAPQQARPQLDGDPVPNAPQAMSLSDDAGQQQSVPETQLREAEAAAMRQARKLASSSAASVQLLSQAAAFRADGLLRPALLLLGAARELDPCKAHIDLVRARLLFQMRRWPEAEAASARSLSGGLDAKEQGRALLIAAISQFQQRKRLQAVSSFLELAVRQPSDGRAWMCLAQAQESLGLYRSAIMSLQHAATLDPRVHDLYLQPLLSRAQENPNRTCSGADANS